MTIGCLGVVAVLLAAVVMLGVYLWWQATTAPRYWHEQRARLSQLTPTERDQRADAAEHRIAGWVSDAQDADPDTNYAATRTDNAESSERTVRLSFEEINAWLDRRLEAWMQQDEIDVDLPVGDVIVTAEDGNLVVASDVQLESLEQVVSAVIDASLQPDGKLHIQVDRIRVGRLRLPNDMVIDYARDNLAEHPNADDIERAVKVLEGTTIDPVYEIDARQVRLTGWSVDDEGVELTIETTPRDEAN